MKNKVWYKGEDTRIHDLKNHSMYTMRQYIVAETTPVEKKDEREKERRKTASTVDEAVNEEKYLYQVIIVATGGSDGVIVLWFLTEPSFLSKETAYAANISGRKGRQLLFHRNCVHGWVSIILLYYPSYSTDNQSYITRVVLTFKGVVKMQKLPNSFDAKYFMSVHFQN